MRRLANKEQEFQDYVSQIAEYKAQQAPTALALRTALLDPAVNLLFERLKKELKATKAKLEETQNELSAWKFTPDSNTGKRLMAKCRLLYQENEELGKMTSNGRLAKLETELAMQKSFSEEVKKSQSELDDFLQELDEDVEGMQSTILFLQQELKTTRDRIQTLEKENLQLKQANTKDEQQNVVTTPPAATNGTAKSKLETISEEMTTTTTTTTTSAATTTILSNPNPPPTNPDYFNGACNNNEQIAEHIIQDNDSNSNSNSNSNGNGNGNAARLARKRNYEEPPIGNANPHSVALSYSVEETTTTTATITAMREVSAPRTLPPKKSKLRGLTTRRSSQIEDELQQQQQQLHQAMTLILDNAAVKVGIPTEDPNAATITPMTTTTTTATSEPVAATTLVDAAATSSVIPPTGAAARILTRRRSVRMEQNGAGVVDYST
ncbi:pre-mRNA-splicing regulator female-lethal(2)D isoform X2 [Drosophila willistoni]|nr:pre-mRNA-splicing regulator female-lethal(2)D isoform X2 [Drosophila willistoni]